MAVYQAIQTKWLPFTNHHDARVKATCAAGTLTVEWISNLSPEENHRNAASLLVKSLNWDNDHYGAIQGGVLKDGTYVWVMVKSGGAK